MSATLPETMCDRCVSPGQCCKRMFISGSTDLRVERDFEVKVVRMQEPMSLERAEHMAMRAGLWMMRPSHQNEDGTWEWSCTALEANGRCGIYEDRPALCRSYRPGQDPMCVHHWDHPPENAA